MAAANVKQQQATSFVSSFGYSYAGNGAYAGSATKLTALTDASGTSLGLTSGQTITLQSTKNGTAQTPATFTVTDTTTLEDLRSFVQTNLAGSTVTIGQGGKMQITSPPGDEQAYTGVTLQGPDGNPLGGAGGVGTTNPPAPTGSLGSVLVHGSGNVHIVSSGIPIDIAVTDGMSMTDVAKAINDKNGSLGASVVNGTLRLQARQQGASSDIQMTMDAGVSLGTFTDAIAASDAAGTVNGVGFTSSSNTVTSAIAGVTLNLQGTTPSAPITLTVDPARVDADDIVNKVKTFVSAYNDVIQELNDKTNEKSVINPTTDEDRVKGALFGDPTLTGLLNQLRTGMQNPVTGLSTGKNIMDYVGLSTGAVGQAYTSDSVSGKLVLDENQLRTSLANGTADIKALFAANGATDDVDGLMQRMSDISFNATRTNGTLQAAVQGSTAESQDITDSINAMQLLLDQREQTLKTQFTAMETALSNLKSMQSSLPQSSSG
jgi:flagellar hook-associated protein 2